MKKTTLLLFVIALFVSVTGNAHLNSFLNYNGKCGYDLTYTFEPSTCLLKIEGSGEMRNYHDQLFAPWYYLHECILNIELPEGLTNIGNKAFQGCYKLTSITIPNSVTSIGESAFRGCSGLTSITIPNSVTSIGNNAFYMCYGLTSITIPNSVTSIGEGAFRGCVDIKSFVVDANNPNYCTENNILYNKDKTTLIYCIPTFKGEVSIPNSVTSIGDYAFDGCSGLTSITIPNSVTSIGNEAFHGCDFSFESFINQSSLSDSANWGATICDEEQQDGLLIKNNIAIGCREWATAITIPNSVTSIGDEAFSSCRGLTSIIIPNSVTSIGTRAFHGCKGLTSINIPNSVTSIGDWAFRACSGLTSITIPNSVTSIGDYAFDGCSGLTSITIPNSVTSIGDYVFDNCTNLTSITLPNSVTCIGDGTFSWCRGLTSITLPNSVTSIGDYVFDNCTNLTSITIPDSVTSIGNNAFSSCRGLTSIIIPNSVTSIGISAFSGCSGLISITIPNSVTNIGGYAFMCCSSLTSITIPDSITSLGDYTFDGCHSLTSITIPNSVTSIGEYPFYECWGLIEIHSNNITTPICSQYTFTGVNTATCKLYVPTGSKEAYASADVWKKFVHIIEEDIINTDSKIEKPTISYENSALKFTSSTPDVKFSYSIQVEDATPTLTEVQDDGIKLSATYIITAYAKTESATSEPATATLVWVDAKLTTDGETTELQSVKAHPILVSSNGGKVTITGLGDNEIVDVYSLSGSKLSTVNSAHGCASFNGIPNSAVIVKVGNRSVKVIVK